MRLRRDGMAEYVRGALWVLPSISVVLALAAGSALSLVDIGDDSPLRRLLFQGTADDARTLLIGIAGTMITVIALVLGLTVVALQLSSTQFSPRLLRNFLRDRPNQVVLSVFVATFAYSTAGLYTVGISAGTRTTAFPRLAVTGALVLLFASLGMLVYFTDHLAHSIQIDTIMGVVVRQTTRVIVHDLPGPTQPDASLPAAPVWAVAVRARSAGYVQALHPRSALHVAERYDATVRLGVAVGDHVAPGMPLAWVWRSSPELAAPDPAMFREAVEAAVRVGLERTLEQDAALGLRQLVDIASKALSPAVNDPYTAVQAVDRLSVVLTLLAARPLGDEVARSADGTLRVVAPWPSFADYLELACGQVRRYGKGEPAVVQALVRMLATVGMSTADPDRTAELARQVRLVVEDAEDAVAQPSDLRALRQEADDVLRTLAP